MNALTGMRIEFHILQSFPVSCLNRDDVNAPKSAGIGGVLRARVSSQCWKRQVRLALHDLGIKLAVRTKQIEPLLEKACLAHGASEEQAHAFAAECAARLSNDTLLFFSEREADTMADFASANNFDPDAIIKKNKLTKEFKSAQKRILSAAEGLDIALFGRMVAQVPEMNIQAAASFAHALSTHRADNEIEFFTALDDLQEEQGSAHMGSLEYNAATYYRYVSLDLGQLADTIGLEDVGTAVEAFTKALYIAVPSARQTTQTALCPWNYAHVYVRKGQGMQVCFDEPVKSRNGYLAPSIEILEQRLKLQERLAGSLFGKKADFIFGKDETFTIDTLAQALAEQVRP